MRRAAKVDGTQAEIVKAGEKACMSCGRLFHSYSKTRKYCSHGCYSQARKVRPDRPCAHCGGMFHPNVDGRKYCSASCNKAARPRVSGYVRRPRQQNLTLCAHCGAVFRSAPSQRRKYCCYRCHIASGGAQRAGDASVMAKLKYGAKKDANHDEIFDAISRFAAVKDLSNAGCGVPDGIAWVAGGWRLFDVKNPKTSYGKNGLNSRQKKWADDWRGGPVYLIYTVEEAIRFARGDFSSIKSFPPAGLYHAGFVS